MRATCARRVSVLCLCRYAIAYSEHDAELEYNGAPEEQGWAEDEQATGSHEADGAAVEETGRGARSRCERD